MTPPALDDYWQKLADVARLQHEPMEQMCRHVVALGYTFEDCRIEHYPELDGARRVVLVVQGTEVFEVTTTITVAFPVITYHITPKVLAWPKAKA